MRDSTPLEATTEFHVGIYDFKKLNICLAGATPVDEEGRYTPAYERAYLKLDLNERIDYLHRMPRSKTFFSNALWKKK